MAKILFCWELGGGLGHLASFAPFAEELRRRGHKVCLAVRNPGMVSVVLGEGWETFRAPVMEAPPPQPFSPSSSSVRLLWNAAWGSLEGLADRLQRWRAILSSCSPHVAIFDHAPTALLAARDLGCRKLLLGAPFSCPGLLERFGDFFTGGAEQEEDEERYVRARVNEVLGKLGWSPVGHLQEVFSVDGVYLTSFPELDLFERRQSPFFLGYLSGSQGVEAQWPEGKFAKVFVYLKEGPVADRVISVLSRLGLASLVFLGGRTGERSLDPGETVRISKEPIALERVAGECDLAITNATHGTTACLLAAGKPMLMFPRYLEQHLTARKVGALGAGLTGQAASLRAIGESIARLLKEPRFSERARAFATENQSFAPQARLLEALEQMERLAATRGVEDISSIAE
jgi:UDP:flavonoid glycosyltransferase YjiC (YdhE family)